MNNHWTPVDDHCSTPDELRLAAAEEERQRLARVNDAPIIPEEFSLGKIIGGIFGPFAAGG
jgi:hypothetical protein